MRFFYIVILSFTCVAMSLKAEGPLSILTIGISPEKVKENGKESKPYSVAMQPVTEKRFKEIVRNLAKKKNLDHLLLEINSNIKYEKLHNLLKILYAAGSKTIRVTSFLPETKKKKAKGDYAYLITSDSKIPIKIVKSTYKTAQKEKKIKKDEWFNAVIASVKKHKGSAIHITCSNDMNVDILMDLLKIVRKVTKKTIMIQIEKDKAISVDYMFVEIIEMGS